MSRQLEIVGGTLIIRGIGEVEIGEPPGGQQTNHQAGSGYATLRWKGETHSFNGRLQRGAIAMLLAAHEAGMPDVPEATILHEIESDSSELRLLFRGHPCWGRLIQRSSLHGGPIGCYRLV